MLLLITGQSLLGSDFPTPHDNQPPTDQPLSKAEDAAKWFNLPEGFKVSLFAAEPDVRNPIAMTWDSRGRLWIAENYTYSDAKERFDLKLRDRILIFEDKDGDGKFDGRKIFSEDLQMLTSLERGQGGVYALCPPHLLWIPDKDGDDIPDGEPVVVLDGISTEAASRHTFANGLKWGPDGWLYGRIGISSTSYIDVPGTPQEKRQPTAGGIWRYHPIKKVYEPVLHGTTNPWGMDWDKNGQLFFINTVIGHLWHGIYGAHFKRMHGEDPYPFVYDQIDQHADHYHWDTGKKWTDSRNAEGLSDELGGGHAHIGMMIYQGVNWPASYRDKLYTLNMHGRRVNVERLERKGSGYVGKHDPDILKSKDFWFRGLEIQYGPDGGVYILDWSDVGECHENDGVHRNSGRIYKVTYGDPKPVNANVAQWTHEQLLETLSSDNEWLVRQARWELRDRWFRKTFRDKGLIDKTFQRTKLRPLEQLMLKVNLGIEDRESLFLALRNSQIQDEYFKAFAVKTLFVDSDPLIMDDLEAQGFKKWIEQEKSALVRLTWASALQKMSDTTGFRVAEALLSHEVDATDHNQPLMIWYGIRNLPKENLVKLFESSKIEQVRALITRRIAEGLPEHENFINQLLAKYTENYDEGAVRALIQGLGAGLKGLRKTQAPSQWAEFVKQVEGKLVEKSDLQSQINDLKVLFGDGRAMDEVRAVALNDALGTDERVKALRSLTEAQDEELEKIALKLHSNPSFSLAAVKALVTIDKAELAQRILGRYRSYYPHEREEIVGLLTQRKSFAKALLEAIKEGKVSKDNLQVVHARQVQSYGDEELSKTLKEVWGEIHQTSEANAALIQKLQGQLDSDRLAKANSAQGRVLFNTLCMACHKLYGEGLNLGPDLTGSGRHDLSYLLNNIVDPNGTVSSDYQVQVLHMKDGRVLSGVIGSEDTRSVTLKMVGQEQLLLKEEITKRERLSYSLMPEGLLTALSEPQVADLIAYLMSKGQVALP